MNKDSNKISEVLFNDKGTVEYKDDSSYQNHLFDQYRMYHHSIESISSRRQNANSFFVTLNTVLVSLSGYINLGANLNGKWNFLIALAGLAISYMWYRLIRSYRDINTAKFKVLNLIETKLPVRPFEAEWQAVGEGKDPQKYLPFTRIEIGIPWVFFCLHILALTSFIPFSN